MGKQLLDGKEPTVSDPAVNIFNLIFIRNSFQSLFVFRRVAVQSLQSGLSVVALLRINTMKLLLDPRLSQPAIAADIIFNIYISLYISISKYHIYIKVPLLSQQHQTQAW